MKKLRISLISCLLALALTGSLIAQNYEFKVMAAKGKAAVQKENSKSWADVKLGTQLNSKDKVKLTGNSYVSLIHKSGRTIELKKAGTFSVAELSKTVGSNKSSVSKRFADYLLDEISSSEDLLAAGEHRGSMQVTGSVERSMNTQPFVNRNALQLNSPRKVNYLNQSFTFRWHEFEQSKDYEFVLSDRFDKPVLTKAVTGTMVTLNADELNLDRDTYYFWSVRAKGKEKQKSDDACFLILSEDRVKAIKDTVEIIKQEFDDENTAAAKIILAAYFEQNHIVDEALKAYKEAVALAPDVEIYDRLYKRFLSRTNISEK